MDRVQEKEEVTDWRSCSAKWSYRRLTDSSSISPYEKKQKQKRSSAGKGSAVTK